MTRGVVAATRHRRAIASPKSRGRPARSTQQLFNDFNIIAASRGAFANALISLAFPIAATIGLIFSNDFNAKPNSSQGLASRRAAAR